MTGRRLRIGIGLATFLGTSASVGVGCGATDQIVATAPCLTNSDCPETDFCSKASCDATGGTCEPKPLSCTSDLALECGCSSHLQYLNDCFRQMNGDSAAGPIASVDGGAGTCQPIPCQSTSSCPSGSYCELLYPGCMTPKDPRAQTGFCLVVPPTCPLTFSLPGETLTPKFFSCVTRACTDFCSAVRAGPWSSTPTDGQSCL